MQLKKRKEEEGKTAGFFRTTFGAELSPWGGAGKAAGRWQISAASISIILDMKCTVVGRGTGIRKLG